MRPAEDNIISTRGRGREENDLGVNDESIVDWKQTRGGGGAEEGEWVTCFSWMDKMGGGGGEEAVGECRFRAPPVSCEKRNARSISL